MKSNLISLTNIGDIATITKCNYPTTTIIEGTVTMISQKGIDITTTRGTTFYKWCHVSQIKKLNYIIKPEIINYKDSTIIKKDSHNG